MRINITLFGLLICTGLSAQNDKRTAIQFDFGTTISIPYKRTVETMLEFEGHPETNYKPGFGYFVEVLLTYNFNTRFGFQSGLNYNQNQLKINDKIGLRESKGTLNKAYINLPILIRYKIAESSPITFSGGAYIGILINANQNGVSIFDTANMVLGQENDPAFIESKIDYDDNIKTNFLDYDIGLSFQCDFEFSLGKNYLGIVFTRFNYGLIDVKSNDIYAGTRYTMEKWKNIGLMLGVGLKI